MTGKIRLRLSEVYTAVVVHLSTFLYHVSNLLELKFALWSILNEINSFNFSEKCRPQCKKWEVGYSYHIINLYFTLLITFQENPYHFLYRCSRMETSSWNTRPRNYERVRRWTKYGKRKRSKPRIKVRVMFPNVLNSHQSLHYYSKYVSEYRHQYEEIIKHCTLPKRKTFGYQGPADLLIPTSPYFVENLLNGVKTEKEDSSVGSPPSSSEYNDDIIYQKSSPSSMTSNLTTETTHCSVTPPMSPASHESRYSSHRRSAKSSTVNADLPTDYSVNRPLPYRPIVSNYAIDRLCASPKTASSSNGTSSPVDSEHHMSGEATPPPTNDFTSFAEDTYSSVSSDKYGKKIFIATYLTEKVLWMVKVWKDQKTLSTK